MSDLAEHAASKRISYLDVARSIAIISITINHAVNRSFSIYSGQYEEFQSIPLYLSILKAVFYAFSRIGVPFFVMISGALLLPREYDKASLKKFLKHNWLYLLIITEIWLCIMFWYLQLLPDSVLSNRGWGYCLVRFVLTLLFINPVRMGSMWYMPMILCVYLLIPILSVALKNIDHKYFLIPMAIVLFCSYTLPDINGALGAFGFEKSLVTELDSSNVFSMYVVYLLAGFFISKGYLLRFSTAFLWVVLAISFIVFCAFQLWIYSLEYHFIVGLDYQSIFPFIVSAAGFELLRRSKINGDGLLGRISHRLSVISFGIYFVHICIMEGLVSLIDHYDLGITLLSKFLVIETISFFGAIAIIVAFKKFKFISKYLFGIKR